MLGLFCSYCVLCRWVVGDLLEHCFRFFYTELCRREFGVSYSTFALLIYFTANRSEKHLKKNLLFFSFPLLRGFLTLSHTIDTECEKFTIHVICPEIHRITGIFPGMWRVSEFWSNMIVQFVACIRIGSSSNQAS